MTKKLDQLIDWLEFTIPHSSDNEQLAVSYLEAFSPTKYANPMHGYTWACKGEFGGQVMFNRKRPEMGVHVILSGQHCQVMREGGEDFSRTALDVLNLSGKASRVDITSDFEHVGLRPQHLMHEFEAKTRKGTARSASIIYSLEQGSTLYVGSWKSDRFARIYEKTRNFDGMDTALLRCELVNKSAYAQDALVTISESGVSSACNVALATLDKMVGFSSQIWGEMMKDKSSPAIIGRKKSDEGDEWLLNIVASALAKRLVLSDGGVFWDKFVDRVKQKAEFYQPRGQEQE